MLTIAANARIFVFQGAVDMRKGFEGLSALAQEAFSLRLTDGAYFVFINRRRDLMKVLYWDGDGLVLWCKRLEKGRYSRKEGGQPLIERRQFFMLLEGIVPMKIDKRYAP
jgi:transposase